MQGLLLPVYLIDNNAISTTTFNLWFSLLEIAYTQRSVRFEILIKLMKSPFKFLLDKISFIRVLRSQKNTQGVLETLRKKPMIVITWISFLECPLSSESYLACLA